MDWIAWIGFGFLISLYSSGFHYLMWYLLNIFPWFAKLGPFILSQANVEFAVFSSAEPESRILTSQHLFSSFNSESDGTGSRIL